MEDLIFGRQPVKETLLAKSRQVQKVLVADNCRGSIVDEIVQLAKNNGVLVQFVPLSRISGLVRDELHQGVAAYVAPQAFLELAELIAQAYAKEKNPVLVALDELKDPVNVGVILRSIHCLGGQGMILPVWRTAPLTQSVGKASSGAIDLVPIAQVKNLVSALEILKKEKFWVVGAEAQGESCFKTDLKMPLVLVVGSEGAGLRRLVKEHCDFIVKIPQRGEAITSLNVAQAASILLYEILRQKEG
ncbi:MAG: 23S rRNA (guanosine(2251)-2'-O)-methyltransferase RlmB [Elusimicrobiota bacterium]